MTALHPECSEVELTSTVFVACKLRSLVPYPRQLWPPQHMVENSITQANARSDSRSDQLRAWGALPVNPATDHGSRLCLRCCSSVVSTMAAEELEAACRSAPPWAAAAASNGVVPLPAATAWAGAPALNLD